MGNPKGYTAPKGRRGVWLPQPADERLRRKFEEGNPDECWPWKASLSAQGYGVFWTGERRMCGHRAVYELIVGPVPPGFFLDHLCHSNDRECPGGQTCRHRRCVNPSHLEVTTAAANKERGRSGPALNAKKTHCPQGHPYSGSNLIITSNGQRKCRVCVYAANRASAARRRATRPAGPANGR